MLCHKSLLLNIKRKLRLSGGATHSPDITYNFVNDIVREYDSLKTKFVQRPTRLSLLTVTWRDDMLFLLELGYTFCYFLNNGDFPYIKFRALPNLSNAQWNSSGIYAILAFILLHQKYRYDNCVCQCSYDSLGDLFDIRKSDSIWLAPKDKIIYKLKKETKDSVGYSTGKLAASSSIYPSK